MKKNNKNGFTLIEIMTVMAIVAVGSLAALPVFTGRIITGQVKDGLVLAQSVKSIVKEYTLAHAQTLPQNNEEAGFPGTNGEFVSKVEIIEGSIVATLGNRANREVAGYTITLTPTNSTSNFLSWKCQFNGDTKYSPYICVNNLDA